jgi:hypothetical protein
MFGMLDYRAHKLLWLLLVPVSLANLLASYAIVLAAAIYVAGTFSGYHIVLKVAIAWLIAQAALLVLALFVWVITSIFKRVFFWAIDVIPAHGSTKEEARQVVLRGPVYALNKKLECAIHEWTEEDTDALVRAFNWRTRWFFPVRPRTAAFVRELRRRALQEGKQPAQLGDSTIDAIRRETGRPDWFEIAVTNAYFFHGALVLAVVVAVIVYTSR